MEEEDAEVYGECATLATPLLEEPAISAHHDVGFSHIVATVEEAILQDILPEMIVQGSSGSYFCRNTAGDIVGVFKPKNEEPYGKLNPKWGKWFQRHFCCFCFGRDCLPTNQGYLSEAGASLVDDVLELGIVPKTKVVRLVSTSFHYSRFDRTRARAVQSAARRLPQVGKRFRQGLPPKIGSFQLFVRGYRDASDVIRTLKFDTLQDATKEKAILQFQKLVVLDYIIRNTDRGLNNWLIKYTPQSEDHAEDIDIKAIDHGLAFPLKHPSDWRAYPYHWAWLSWAKFPFTDTIAESILPKIEDDGLIENLCDRLYVMFSQDSGFSRSVYDKQTGVLRGQVINLRKALKERMTPADLVELPTLTVHLTGRRRWRRRQRRRTQTQSSTDSTDTDESPRYRQNVTQKRPFFKRF